MGGGPLGRSKTVKFAKEKQGLEEEKDMTPMATRSTTSPFEELKKLMKDKKENDQKLGDCGKTKSSSRYDAVNLIGKVMGHHLNKT